jgi:hypothetical protein
VRTFQPATPPAYASDLLPQSIQIESDAFPLRFHVHCKLVWCMLVGMAPLRADREWQGSKERAEAQEASQGLFEPDEYEAIINGDAEQLSELLRRWQSAEQAATSHRGQHAGTPDIKLKRLQERISIVQDRLSEIWGATHQVQEIASEVCGTLPCPYYARSCRFQRCSQQASRTAACRWAVAGFKTGL